MQPISSSGRLRVLAVGAVLLSAPLWAQAQTSSSAAAVTTPPGGQLEEVIVTATKRAVNLQDVPVAITAVSGASLVADHVMGVRDLADEQPGLAYTESDPFDQQIAIRGIVTVHLNDPTAEPAVATFVDGVYLGGQGATINELYDIDHIEITRGPQGVIYGKNVTGGAISITTAKPEFTPSGAVDASYGNFESSVLSGHYTAPINDVLAGRIAFQLRNSDGYSRSLPLNRRMDGYTSEQVRAELLYRPSDTLQALLSIDFGRQFTSDSGRTATADPFSPPPGTVLVPGTPPLVFGAQSQYEAQHGTYNNVRVNYDPTPDYTHQQSQSATLTIDWNVLPQAKVTSISNVRVGVGVNLFQQLQAPSPPLLLDSAVFENFKPHEYSEDLRIASTNAALPFNYIAGLYWYHNEETAYTSNFAVSPLSYCTDFGGIICGHSVYTEDAHLDTEAAYGQIGYEIFTGLTLTVGARYTEDKKTGLRDAQCAFGEYNFQTCSTPLSIPPGATFVVPFDRKWGAFTPQAVLNYQITPENMVYASWNKGFKGGGYDQNPATAAVAAIAFNPEKATNYEIGTKNELFNRSVRLNLALYYLSYKDLQVQEINDICLCLVTNNAGAAISKGIELETQYIVNDTLRFTLNDAYIYAHYTNFIDAGVNESGNQLQLSPAEKGTFGFSLTPDLGGSIGRSFDLRAEYTVQSKYYLAPANTNYQGGYGLVNGFLTYAPADAHWSVSLWGRNLGDKVFPLYANAFLGDVQTSWAPPREYGVSAHYDFAPAKH